MYVRTVDTGPRIFFFFLFLPFSFYTRSKNLLAACSARLVEEGRRVSRRASRRFLVGGGLLGLLVRDASPEEADESDDERVVV